MATETSTTQLLLDAADREELTKLVNAVALSENSLTLFAITPDSSPYHPVVEEFTSQLRALEESLEFRNLHYSEYSLFQFLHDLDRETLAPQENRRVVMAFGLEQLPLPRLNREMEQLNLGRERIFERNLVLVFWLNRETFLDEFRHQAADFWDWQGGVGKFTTRPTLEPLLYPYLEWTIAENSHLKMSGIMQVNRQVDISLDRIYVSLQGEWVEERSQSFRERVQPGEGSTNAGYARAGYARAGYARAGYKPAPTDFLPQISSEPISQQRVTRTVDLAEAVRKHNFSAILGDPGAGKTTLLRYLARHFAIAHRDKQPQVLGGQQEDLGETRLPILFRIADYAERLAKQPDLTLVDYLKLFYRQWQGYFQLSEVDAVANLLLEKMARGDCLLLLDGLDEVFDQSSRMQVVAQINGLVNAYRTNKFVTTSRIAGYREAALGSWFREFTITPMGDSQIEEFLQRWCLAIEEAQRPSAEESLRQRDAEAEARGIVEAIATKPGVKRFASNPLLLTILALIHRNGTKLPQRRVELYDLATKTLIEDWQQGRNIPYRAQRRQLLLMEEEVTALLAPLAFRMHEEKSSGLVEQVQVEEWLTSKMVELQGVDEPTALELVRQFLRKVRETTGLFVERGPGVYGFMHLTFEEYFAARQIADNEIDDILQIISSHRNQARWNEPILLALGYLSKDRRRINRLVERLLSGLDAYQPTIAGREIRLKGALSANPVLVWFDKLESEKRESNTVWQDLLFTGEVLAEVKVSPVFCRQQVEKLVLTYVGLERDYWEEPIQQLMRLLRGIEVFNHEVLGLLQQVAEDKRLLEEQQNRAWVAMLYVVCGEAGELLTDRVTYIINRLTPALFNKMHDLVAQLGADMTSALERTLEDANLNAKQRQALEFMTGLSYLQSDSYDLAIAYLQPLIDQVDSPLDGYIQWAIAIAYEEKENYDQGLQYYQNCSQKLRSYILWRDWGWCHQLHEQYEQSLEYYQQALAIVQQLNDYKAEANILWHIGLSYQDWGRYEQAIAHYEQSRNIYQQLGKETEVGDQWYNLAVSYRLWGKYELALTALQQDLAIYQEIDDELNVAEDYYQLGRIYQDWGKYEQAISYYEKSRDLYQKLDKEAHVANQWYKLANCYREWGQYELALTAAQQGLTIREKLDDQPDIADAYFQ